MIDLLEDLGERTWKLTSPFTTYENGEWKDKDRAYVTSSWATPGFKAEMENGDVIEVVAMTEETEEQAAEREAKSKKLREDMKVLATELAEYKTANT